MTVRMPYELTSVEREALDNVPNVFTTQEVLETDGAGYLIRPWMTFNLYDRISTRPFLTDMEKVWISYQLIYAMHASHAQNVAHGDLKCENVLITSSLTAYVTDFASSFKPTYLPLDDPTDFSLFFDSSGRRICHIAPERFYESVTELPAGPISSRTQPKDIENMSEVLTYEPYLEILGLGRPNGRITEAMDVFSLGCVLAELWRDGSPLFTLSQMYRYRARQYDINPLLQSVSHSGMRDVITSMLALDPEKRPTFKHLLRDAHGILFPESFSVCLHLYLVDLQRPSPDIPLPQPPNENQGDQLRTRHFLEPDDRIEKLYEDWATLQKFFGAIPSIEGDQVQLHVSIPNVSLPHQVGRPPSLSDNEALLVLNVILANIRHCHRPSSKCHALELVVILVWGWLSDETRLDRVLPYLIALLTDKHPRVRAMALHGISVVFECIHVISAVNKRILHEFVWPHVVPLSHDPSVHVRCTLVSCLARISTNAMRLWFTSPTESFDTDVLSLQEFVRDQMYTLVCDSSSTVKCVLLSHATSLCTLLNTDCVKSVLLTHMLTYLNDENTDLRMAFFDAVVPIARLLESDTIEKCIYPFLLQALGDDDVRVQVQVLRAIQQLIPLFQPFMPWKLLDRTISLLYHPNPWVREASIGVVTEVSSLISNSDRWLRLYARIRPYLRCDITSITPISLLDHLVSPLSSHALQQCVSTMKTKKDATFLDLWYSQVRRVEIKDGVSSTNMRKEMDDLVRPPSSSHWMTLAVRIEEPHPNILSRLDGWGIPSGDIPKLAALWWYVEILATKNTRQQAKPAPPNMKLSGVRQRTVFFTPRIAYQALPSSVSIRTAQKRIQDLACVSSSQQDSREPQEQNSESELESKPQFEILNELSRKSEPSHFSYRSHGRTASKASSDATSLSECSIKWPVFTNPSTAQASTTLIHAHAERARAESAKEESDQAPGMLVVENTYEGMDPYIHAHLKAAYQQLQEQSRTVVSQHTPCISHVQTSPAGSHRPHGALVACLTEHTAAITSLSVALDQMFFVSGSDDGTVKVWDTSRLEKNVNSRSRLTYATHQSPITSVLVLSGTHCVISASKNGSLHVWGVGVQTGGSLPRYMRPHILGKHTLSENEYVRCLAQWTSGVDPVVVLGTSRGRIILWDVRHMNPLLTMSHPAEHGPVETLVLDPQRNWICTGTSCGVIGLWDVRFELCIRAWTVKSQSKILSCTLHPCYSRRILVAWSTHEPCCFATLDLDTGLVTDMFNVIDLEHAQVPDVAENLFSPCQDATHHFGAETTLPNLNGTHVLLASVYGYTSTAQKDTSLKGWILSAGSDRVVRFWDLGQADRCVAFGVDVHGEFTYVLILYLHILLQHVEGRRDSNYAVQPRRATFRPCTQALAVTYSSADENQTGCGCVA